MDEVEPHDESYQETLGRLLAARDLVGLRAFLVANAERFGDQRQVQEVRAMPDEQLRLIMHRMILSRNDLKHVHAESRRALGVPGGPGSGSSGPGRPGGQGRAPGKGAPRRAEPGGPPHAR